MRALSLLAGGLYAGLLLCACSGGSGSSATISGLSVPAQVNLVDAQDDTATFQLPPGVAAVTYDEDPTEFYVRDDSMEPLQTVNIILCSIRQTGYDDPSVLNKGPYVALVGCEERGGERGGRGGDQVQYQRFVVDSRRDSADAPHVVDFWFDSSMQVSGSRQPSVLSGRLTITESPSATAPYGNFAIHFKNLLATQDPDDENIRERGYLRTVPRNDSQVEFEFFNVGGDVEATQANGEESYRQRARFVGQADGTAGRAYSEALFAYNQGSGSMSGGSEFFLQFNSDYLARKRVAGSTEVKVFDRNDFTANVYRYGVYDATTGERVEAQSGFSLENATGEQGWVGYHGLWFPDSVTITDGQTLTKRGFGDEPDETYSAVVVPGRLEKRSRESSTLGNLVDEDMEFFDPSTGSLIRVRWTGSLLVQNGTADGSGGWTEVDPPVSIASSFSDDDWVDLYHPTRGSVHFIWQSTPTNSTPVYSWVHETITGSSPDLANGNLTLSGYWNCLKANITANQANFVLSDTPYYPDATDISGVRTYVFDRTTLMLTIGGAPVRLADGVNPTSGPGMYGFETGPLYATPLTALTDSGMQTTTYVWRTGPANWNQLRTVKDGNGDFVAFDAPLRLPYTHDDDDDAIHDDKTFQLEWTGSELHGIPFYEETATGRWRPGFNIPSGTVITVGNTGYRIKQLEGEQEMVEVGSPETVIATQGFDLDTTLTAPTDAWVNPEVGAMPTIDEPATFVDGVRQSEDA